MCIIGYNVFFADDEPEDKTVKEKPAVVEQQLDENRNKIDSVIKDIKKEIQTSVVIQDVKEELVKIKDELTIDKEPPQEPKPKEEEPPVMTADTEKEELPKLEKSEEDETKTKWKPL
jgi:hypothetical protein